MDYCRVADKKLAAITLRVNDNERGEECVHRFVCERGQHVNLVSVFMIGTKLICHISHAASDTSARIPSLSPARCHSFERRIKCNCGKCFIGNTAVTLLLTYH